MLILEKCRWFLMLAVSAILTCRCGAADEVEPAKADQPASKLIEIADEPATIDPATLVPKPLAKKATVKFSEATLKEVVKWLQEEQGLSVLIHQQEIIADGGGASLSESITDELKDAPIYQLLDRLRMLGLGWYMDEGLVHLTSLEKSQEHMTTVSYLIGDLVDAGFEAKRIMMAVQQGIRAEWEVADGVGGRMVLLGDVLFVRQPESIQRQIAGLLEALRKPTRRTFVADEPIHAKFRQQLQQPVSIDVQDKPLVSAIAELSDAAEIDIRLDRTALKDRQIRERTLVSLKLADQKLSVVLQALLAEWDFTWVLQEGVLWITSRESAEQFQKTAVYDVRDLCRDDKESAALQRAIVAQTSGEWMDYSGVGGTLTFPRPGILVVLQTEPVLAEISQLLDDYRVALRASKPRAMPQDQAKEMITRFYRLPANIAGELVRQMPQLVKSDSWNRDDVTIRQLPSRAEVINNAVIPFSVLIIHQMREIHDELGTLIQKLEHGEAVQVAQPASESAPGMMGGMGGMGGGGFGGGFFSVTP